VDRFAGPRNANRNVFAGVLSARGRTMQPIRIPGLALGKLPLLQLQGKGFEKRLEVDKKLANRLNHVLKML
jgi:hypothetical protein